MLAVLARGFAKEAESGFSVHTRPWPGIDMWGNWMRQESGSVLQVSAALADPGGGAGLGWPLGIDPQWAEISRLL